MAKKGEYNYEKWVPIVDFIGLADQEKKDWLINYFQQLEDNGNPRVPAHLIDLINPTQIAISSWQTDRYVEFRKEYENHLDWCLTNNNAQRTQRDWDKEKASDFYKRNLHMVWCNDCEQRISDTIDNMTPEEIKLIRLAITRLIGNNVAYVTSKGRDRGNDDEVNAEIDKLWKLLDKLYSKLNGTDKTIKE